MTTCRTCWLSTLPESERERVAAEEITTSVYLCPEHQRNMDALLDRMALQLQIHFREHPFTLPRTEAIVIAGV
jgi:hypothetical protein